MRVSALAVGPRHCGSSVLGSNEQIFGADEQLPKGGCGRCPKNTPWTRELRKRQKKGLARPVTQSGRAEYRDIRSALLTGPSQQWLGPFPFHGSNEQIFGVEEQILGPDQSDQWASAWPAWWWHRPTDARVIAGTVLGVASMFARRHW